MALTYPLSLASYFDTLLIAEFEPDLTEALTGGETGGGEAISSDYGPRLWQARLVASRSSLPKAARSVALTESLRRAGTSFFATDPLRRYPQADPDGSLLGGAAPSITSVASNNRDVTLGGLPASYVLTPGDLIAWDYDTSRRAMHRIVVGATANGSGVATIELEPFVRGTPAGASVDLIDPSCKAKILTGSYSPRTLTRRGGSGFSFIWRQTLAP